MFKPDVEEATPIVERALDSLLLTLNERGRTGADARAAIGALKVQAPLLLRENTIGLPLDNCFSLARKAGATLPGIVNVRRGVLNETTKLLGATLIKNALIDFCLVYESLIIADMTFVNRDDVEAVKRDVNAAYGDAEEVAADEMDSATYRALVSLHAATVRLLVETQRPLPRMLAFRFAAPLTTLVAAHRLYDDAGRADELRVENKVVHPAFMRQEGRALSA